MSTPGELSLSTPGELSFSSLLDQSLKEHHEKIKEVFEQKWSNEALAKYIIKYHAIFYDYGDHGRRFIEQFNCCKFMSYLLGVDVSDNIASELLSQKLEQTCFKRYSNTWRTFYLDPYVEPTPKIEIPEKPKKDSCSIM